MTMDFSPFQSVFGENIAGIIGYDVLRRSVVCLELSESRMTLHEPQTYALTRGVWRDLHFQNNHPIIEAKVNGVEGLFRLDVGASGGPHGNVVFHSPAVRALGLMQGQQTQEAQLGVEKAAVGTVRSLEIGGEHFGETEVMFALGDSGLFADVHTLGSIGVDLLRAFDIVFDYSRTRLALIPKQSAAENGSS